MRTIVLVSAITLLAGCDDATYPTWDRAPLTHSCTPEQMSKVQTEAAWCSANTTYFSTYCYGSAILRNCTRKP